MQSSTTTYIQSESQEKYVTKRDGSKMPLNIEKIKKRLQTLAKGLSEEFLNLDVIVNKVATGIFSGKYKLRILIINDV
jgi:transcriptional regulator NrdR family protein